MVRDQQRSAFREIGAGIIRLRNSICPWIVILAAILAWLGFGPSPSPEHELIWAAETESASPALGFGGWWLAYVARPIFVALLAAWLWRVVLTFLLLKRIAGLDLALAPTHPNRAGGLGFLEKLPNAFSLLAFSLSAVIASRMAHDVVYHGVHVLTLKGPILDFLVLITLMCLAPLLVFIPKLAAAKRLAVLQYGALVGEHGRLVQRRWIQREPVEDSPLLDAPELGPVADKLSLYEAVAKMRSTPIGKTAVKTIVLPAAIPMFALFAIEIPIKEMLLKLLSSLA